MSVRRHGVCTSCGGPASEQLTPMGKAVWSHDTATLEDAPGDWISNGTGYVPPDDHAPTIKEEA